MRRRIVFINLHGNEFLVKTINKILFGQSCAVKHGYLLQHLLSRDDIEVCSFITKRGLSLSYTTQNPLLQAFRFLEHRFVLHKNRIPFSKIKVISDSRELRPDDILIAYSYYAPNQLSEGFMPDCTRVICQIHFNTQYGDLEKAFAPHAMYNEADLQKHSAMWKHDLPWYENRFITIPFVSEDRFTVKKSWHERKTKAVSVGTITYMHNITEFYGDPCAQPARAMCRRLAKKCPDIIDSFNFDYLEDQQPDAAGAKTEGKNQKDSQQKKSNALKKILHRLHSKATTGHQNRYYSFDMVDKLNSYRMAVVGEEIMGIPGIGFVEAMACGCAFIGQRKGYYEDLGLIEGVHYIGYDGTEKGLEETIRKWQEPSRQEALEKIANTGQKFVKENFNKDVVARKLIAELLAITPDNK